MTAPQLPQSGTGAGPRLGSAVMVVTVIVAALGLLVSVIQLDNVLHGRLRDRTPLGLSLMALGFIGPVVAVGVLRRRRALRLKGPGAWGSLALFPGIFLLLWAAAFLAYWTLGTVGRPVLPHTPGLAIRFDPAGRPHLDTEGEIGFRDSTGEPVGQSLAPDGRFEFRIHPDVFGEGAITFTGSATRTAGGRVEVRGELVLGTRARFRVEGLAGAVLVIDDSPRNSPVLLEPGTYHVAVSGSRVD